MNIFKVEKCQEFKETTKRDKWLSLPNTSSLLQKIAVPSLLKGKYPVGSFCYNHSKEYFMSFPGTCIRAEHFRLYSEHEIERKYFLDLDTENCNSNC